LRSLREKKTALATNTTLRALREIKKVPRQDAKKKTRRDRQEIYFPCELCVKNKHTIF